MLVSKQAEGGLNVLFCNFLFFYKLEHFFSLIQKHHLPTSLVLKVNDIAGIIQCLFMSSPSMNYYKSFVREVYNT